MFSLSSSLLPSLPLSLLLPFLAQTHADDNEEHDSVVALTSFINSAFAYAHATASLRHGRRDKSVWLKRALLMFLL